MDDKSDFNETTRKVILLGLSLNPSKLSIFAMKTYYLTKK